MAKSINWSKEFLEEISTEDSQNERIALRIGNLYYDNNYFLKNDIVYIRVDQKIVRKAVITKPMQLCSISEIPDETLNKLKTKLRDKKIITEFLSENYNQEVTLNTPVTIVFYQNLKLEKTPLSDDPHM